MHHWGKGLAPSPCEGKTGKSDSPGQAWAGPSLSGLPGSSELTELPTQGDVASAFPQSHSVKSNVTGRLHGPPGAWAELPL